MLADIFRKCLLLIGGRIAWKRRKKIGELLVEAGLITEKDLDEVLLLQKTTGKRFGDLVVKNGNVTEEQLIEVLEFQLKLARVNLKNLIIDPSIPRLIGENHSQKALCHSYLPGE